MAEIRRAVNDHGLLQWLHLTLRFDGPPRPDRDARKLLKKWAALRNLYLKHFGQRMPYVWFKHVEKGRPHLHIFTAGLDLRWVEREWRRRTGAFQIELQDIDPATMPTPALYATRLIYDNALEYGRSCGRWWGSSQHIDIDVRQRGRGDGEWQLVLGPIDLHGYRAGEYSVLGTDAVGRPTSVRIHPKPEGAQHAC